MSSQKGSQSNLHKLNLGTTFGKETVQKLTFFEKITKQPHESELNYFEANRKWIESLSIHCLFEAAISDCHENAFVSNGAEFHPV